jgi:hypothetical protein
MIRRCTRSAVAFLPFTGEHKQVRLLVENGAFTQLKNCFCPVALLLRTFRERERTVVLGGYIVSSSM